MTEDTDFIKDIKVEIKTYMGKAIAYDLSKLRDMGIIDIEKLPYSLRIMLENIIRNAHKIENFSEMLKKFTEWPSSGGKGEISFFPSRIILQDFTGVPLVVDLAAMRDAAKDLGADPRIVNPVIPSHLIIDHSVQVDYYGVSDALIRNMQLEFRRNRERYRFLKWAQNEFSNFRVFPPGSGIIHQINLEYLARVIELRNENGVLHAYPDTVLGTDSHTTTINGIGVVGWGVGGIEAEGVMLGLPYELPFPEVIGVKLVGELPPGTTATDLVLYITERLRKKGVVGKFVEYFGPSIKNLPVPNRATISNMSPEYGSTIGYFPIDKATIDYLTLTGRDPGHVQFVRDYVERFKLIYNEEIQPVYSDIVEIDLSDVEPAVSGPAHPEDRIPLKELKKKILQLIEEHLKRTGKKDYSGYILAGKDERDGVILDINGEKTIFNHGSVIIAAIASCTNTPNPLVVIAAGLLAKKAVERGLRTKPHVKTSLTPGSRVVVKYLNKLGLLPYLEALRFHVAGFGCASCIGNSGPLNKTIEKAIRDLDIYSVSVISANRNFSGRIHPLSRGNFLASPPLVVAFALAGRLDIDPINEPLTMDPNGEPVYLRDIWPSMEEIYKAFNEALDPELYRETYRNIEEGSEDWKKLEAPSGIVYHWEKESTYIRKPPYFEGFKLTPEKPKDIKKARVLVLLGDRVSTDHISPAGAIPPDSPAGKYLLEHGVSIEDFNTYGSRRGNHEVMMRGTFANIKLKNYLVPDREGGWTKYIPTGEIMSIYEAAMRYKKENIPVIVIAGKQYGVGSSRDWAAKGPALLGVRAVIAESFERIHRSNLIGMGVLPLEFKEGENWRSLGLTGEEEFDIIGISEGLHPRKELKVIARKGDKTIEFNVIASLNTWVEVEFYEHGGILPYTLRKLIKE